MMKMIRTRIAPSPTGEDLHIGNVYTALLNFAFAKKNKGKFIVRIEDTDRTRRVEGSEERILESLKWFGLDYNEGPDKDGSYGPYRQSERKEIYVKYARELVEKGYAYHCFCTPERLEEMRKKQMAEGKPTLYDGYCKRNKKFARPRLSLGEAGEAGSKNNKYVIRLNVPDEGVTEFDDVIRGKISFENKLIDDQVLIKSDGFPTYHMGVVVDDHLMEISHIIRAEEWIPSTPKHVLIYKFLDWPLPIFAHGPILRNPDKSKLSKRKNPVWASWYKEQGYLPEAILNYLALQGWSFPVERGEKEKDVFTIDEFADKFSLEDLKTVGPAFDLKKLEWMNGEYIRKLKTKNLKLKIRDYIGDNYDDDILERSVPLVQERIKKLSDYLPLAEFFFRSPESYEIDLTGYKKLISSIFDCLSASEIWSADLIGENLMKLAKDTGVKPSEFFMVLRVAVTGKKISPPLNESIEILGKKETLNRLKKFIQ